LPARSAGRRAWISATMSPMAPPRICSIPPMTRTAGARLFLSLSNNQEMLLVSQNTATCTGDKAGDGEAFSFDNNAIHLVGARGDRGDSDCHSITIAEPLAARQMARYPHRQLLPRPLDSSGRGPVWPSTQILAYSEDRASGRTTFQVSSAWDVIPAQVRRA